MYDKNLSFDPHEIVKPLFVKNLLYHTFNNPSTIEDLSLEMGMSKPYVEDVLNSLLGVKYLIKDGNKYKSNIVFLDYDTVSNVRNELKQYYIEYANEVIKFARENIDNYRSKLFNKDISDGLLMWSLLMTIRSFTDVPESKYTKKYGLGNGQLSFCMYEVSAEYDENDYHISWNGFGDRNVKKLFGHAYPGSNTLVDGMPKTHKRIRFSAAAKGLLENASLFSKIVHDNIKYDSLNPSMKKEVDMYIDYNYIKVEDSILKIAVPMMSANEFEDFKLSILKDKSIKDSFMNLYTRANEIISKKIPEYLNEEVPFLVNSILNNDRTYILKEADKQGLLDFDEEHEYFVYNMLLVKC